MPLSLRNPHSTGLEDQEEAGTRNSVDPYPTYYGLEHQRDLLWQRLAIAMPYVWLLVFFLAPFAIIFKISLADPIIAQPPFTPSFNDAGDFQGTVDNFAFLLTDKL